MTLDVLSAIQAYTARSAITSSSMRGAAAGAIPAARDFLGELPLGPFGTTSRAKFSTQLDRATDRLMKELPKKARSWGRARKGLNIFLRGCLYTSYLRDEYRLGQAEDFFEVPLDSITGVRLFEASGGALPSWTTVRDLDAETSEKYQSVAAATAAPQGIARVHLDAVWWGRRDE